VSSLKIPALERRLPDSTPRGSGAAWARLLFVAVAVFFLHVAYLFREPSDDAAAARYCPTALLPATDDPM